MADNLTANVAAANRLKISPQAIRSGQVWSNQIKGLYHLLYPLIHDDFSHTDDIKEWITQFFNTHIHPTSQGPSGPPTIAGFLLNARGLSNLRPLGPVGRVRTGFSDLIITVHSIDQVNNEQV